MPPPRPFEDRPPLPGAGHAENYTTPFLIAAGLLCYIGLVMLWAILGLPLVVAGAVLAGRVMRRPGQTG